MDDFGRDIEQMRRIYRGEETYGAGKPHQQAARFRLEHLLDPSATRARERYLASPDSQQPVDLLVSLAGLSPETTIMACRILSPRRLVVLTSEGARDGIDVIGQHVIGADMLSFKDFSWVQCDPTDPLEIYDQVRKHIDALKGVEERPVTVIDITGGKKVMSAAAATAAWRLGLRLCYLDGDTYDPSLRQPVPGTERLLFLGNPAEVFGDEATAAAIKLFDSGAFQAAEILLADLAERISKPTWVRFLRDMARLYAAWCSLDLESLLPLVDTVEGHLGDPRVKLDPESERRLHLQVAFCRRLSVGLSEDFLLSHFVLADHYHRMGRRDFAALLYYRTIEGCMAERLRGAFGGFDTGAPDYSLLGRPEDAVLAEYNSVAAAVFPKYSDVDLLPAKLGFMTSAFILYVMEDRLLPLAEVRNERGLKHLFKIGNSRSQSVLAHGYRSIAEREVAALAGMALQMLRALWSLNHGGDSVDARCSDLGFVKFGS